MPSCNNDCDSDDEDREKLPMPFQDEDTGQDHTYNMAVPAVVNAINAYQASNQCVLEYKRTVQPQPEKKVRGR